MPQPQVVILAAGLGTRLGGPVPKPLTRLADGSTIMGRQVAGVRAAFGDAVLVTAVVGFKLELVMEAFPDLRFVYNELYDRTNTAVSLRKALRLSDDGGVLWMNGDVVFDAAVIERVAAVVGDDESFVCVNTAAVGDEEVKYTVDADGYVRALSKQVAGALGEAVGINYVASADKALLVEHLGRVDDMDYFERGIETAVEQDGLRVRPVDISDLFAVEVDVEADLAAANAGLDRPAGPAQA